MVDSMASSVEDYLIEGLSFKLNPGASYVSDRRSVSYFPSGSNIYQAGSGARVIRVNLTGDGWLDPSTVRVQYTLVNNDTTTAKSLRVLSGPWSFFRRARCMVGGAIVDDVDYYNRVHEMLHILTSKGKRDNDSIEGFGSRWDDDALYNTWASASGLANSATIPGGSAKPVSFKPLFGLLNQPKYIPLMWSPLMFEFEVVNGATDAIAGGKASFRYDLGTNTSQNWQIQDVRIVCDVVTLDSALQNSYAEHVLSGKALPINYGSYISQFQSITATDFAVSVTRAVSRLKSVFINFDGTHPEDASATDDAQFFHRSFNTFMSPMTNAKFSGADYDFNKEFQWQLQIGSKMFPEFPCRSMAETFYQLQKALGIHGSAFHSLSITPAQYRNDHFIIGVDTEKILEAGFTGLNTKSGDLMVVRGKGANANLPSWATNIYIILHTDQILEIRDTGCQVFD
jgi:hypothetical protein